MSVSGIRQSMATTVKALSPLLLAGRPFREHKAVVPFRPFCEEHPIASLRLFSVYGTGTLLYPTVTNTDQEWIQTEVVCEIAYPLDFQGGPLAAMDRRDLMESDMRQVSDAIGTNGYASLETAVSGTVRTIDSTYEEGQACAYSVLRLEVQYWRAMP